MVWSEKLDEFNLPEDWDIGGKIPHIPSKKVYSKNAQNPISQEVLIKYIIDSGIEWENSSLNRVLENGSTPRFFPHPQQPQQIDWSSIMNMESLVQIYHHTGDKSRFLIQLALVDFELLKQLDRMLKDRESHLLQDRNRE